MTPHTARTSSSFVVVLATFALLAVCPPPAVAQQTRALVAPYLHIPAGIRFAEIVPQVYGARAAEVARLEAFTLPDVDERTVFVNIERPLWKAAASGGAGACVYRAMLASIVAHELAHLRGERSEVAALKEERRAWLRLVRDHVVPTELGLQRGALLDREIARAALAESVAGREARLQ